MHIVRGNHREAGPARRQGIALVLVLWILALLSVIAGSLVFSSRTEVLMAANLVSAARGEAAADAGVHKAIYELTRPATDVLRWNGDGLTHSWDFGGARLLVTILDESGKVDVNTASIQLLKGLFLAVGVPDSEADSLVDAIADWRDQDDLRSLHGAERAEYSAAGRDDGPSNAPFEAIEELQQVLGLGDEIFARIEPFVTVHSRLPGVATAVAPRTVLLALPGSTPEQVDIFVEQRRALLEQGLPPPPFPGAAGFTTRATHSVFSIRVEAVMEDNTRFLRESVVRLPGDADTAVTILAWRAPRQAAALN